MGLGWGRHWGLSRRQGWATRLEVLGTTLGRRSGSQRSHNVDWLDAIGHLTWSERQDLFAGVRKPLVAASLVDWSDHLQVKGRIQMAVLPFLH